MGFGEGGAFAFEVGGEGLLGGGVDLSLLAQLRVDGVDKEINMDVELEFDGLGVLGSHGNGDVLSEPGEKEFARTLFECLQFQKNVLGSFPV